MKRLKYVLHTVVFVGLLWAGMKYVNGAEFWRAMHRFEWAYLLPILICALAHFGLKALRFVFLMRQVDPAPGGMVARAYLAGQACAVLPWGITARAGLLKETGVPVSHSGPAIAISSASDQALLLLCSIVAALWFEPARKPVLMLLTALIVVSILLGIHATRSWIAGMVDRLMGRFNLQDRWHGFLQSLRYLLHPRVLVTSLVLTAFAVALMVVALELALHGVEAEVPYFTSLLAFTLPSMLGRLSAMPAGVGVTEAGMLGILTTTPGVSIDQAAAAVTVFRVGTVLFEALVGGGVYVFGWRGEAERRAAAEPAVARPERVTL